MSTRVALYGLANVMAPLLADESKGTIVAVGSIIFSETGIDMNKDIIIRDGHRRRKKKRKRDEDEIIELSSDDEGKDEEGRRAKKKKKKKKTTKKKTSERPCGKYCIFVRTRHMLKNTIDCLVDLLDTADKHGVVIDCFGEKNTSSTTKSTHRNRAFLPLWGKDVGGRLQFMCHDEMKYHSFSPYEKLKKTVLETTRKLLNDVFDDNSAEHDEIEEALQADAAAGPSDIEKELAEKLAPADLDADDSADMADAGVMEGNMDVEAEPQQEPVPVPVPGQEHEHEAERQAEPVEDPLASALHQFSPAGQRLVCQQKRE